MTFTISTAALLNSGFFIGGIALGLVIGIIGTWQLIKRWMS